MALMALLVITSCSRDNEEEVLTEQEKKFELLERRGPISNEDSCIITVGMVSNDEPGSYTMAPFSVYASCGGNTKNYPRRVEIFLTDGDDVVDVAYVTIEANQNVSNNAAVQGCGGAVNVRIANVLNLATATLDNSCTWRGTVGYFDACNGNNYGYNVDYCNGFDQSEYLGDVDPDYLPQNNDSDGDGLCSGVDPDDDDPCWPIQSNCW